MDAVVEEASQYEQSAMAASILSPMNSSINQGSLLVSKKITQSEIFHFDEVDANNFMTVEYESEEEGLEEYKPSWNEDQDGGNEQTNFLLDVNRSTANVYK